MRGGLQSGDSTDGTKTLETQSSTGCGVPASLHGEKFSVSWPSFALRQRALQCFNKLDGVANVPVHLHDHFDVGVLDPVCVDEVRLAKRNAAGTLVSRPPNACPIFIS